MKVASIDIKSIRYHGKLMPGTCRHFFSESLMSQVTADITCNGPDRTTIHVVCIPAFFGPSALTFFFLFLLPFYIPRYFFQREDIDFAISKAMRIRESKEN